MLLNGFHRTVIVAGILLACAGGSHAANKAKVKSGALQMYAQPSSASNAVGQLKKGELVTIELQLSSPQGAWCNVRSGAKTGYVKCEELLRLPRGPRTAAAKPEPRTLYNETCGNGRGDTWQQRYNLTSAQLATAQALAEKLGVLKCGQRAAQFQQAFHAVGITAQTMDGLKTQWWERERQEHCGDQLQLFLQQLQNSVSPEQKELLENDRKEIHRLATTGQLPPFCAF